ncbi:MAG TPA: hypothetical protein VFT69_16995 [Pseudolabrys sp.]|nr:hypothetical protein [Pseudolabrys sp.]
MSAAAATELVRKMVFEEKRHTGDAELAMHSLARRYSVGFWTLDHLRKGRAKTCDSSLLARLRLAYLDICQRQLTHLQNEIATEKAAGDDTLADLELEAAALAQKIQARKAALR